MKKIKIGIIICGRYSNCAAGKCFRAAHNSPAEMKKNGVEKIHFATCLLVGYPPCPRIEYFKKFIEEKYGIEVVYGSHPIPQNYFVTHTNLKTWNSEFFKKAIIPALTDEKTRLSYD